jgi:hypothetical protein
LDKPLGFRIFETGGLSGRTKRRSRKNCNQQKTMFGKKPVEDSKPQTPAPAPATDSAPATPPAWAVKSRVQFTGPLGVVNTGTVLKIEGDLLAVAMDVPVVTLTKGEAKIIG